MTNVDQAGLADPFGSYRAEWLNEALFEMFTEPSYFPELEAARPCVLLGGRGTGKTTVLRCLSYEGRYALAGRQDSAVEGWRYFGVYYRVNTNRVTAFDGPELSERQWTKVFGHYVNLVLCGQLVQFARWHRIRFPSMPTLSGDDCAAVATALRVTDAEDLDGLSKAIEYGRLQFEAFLNNLADDQLPPLSMQGQPLDELCAALHSLPQFSGKSFFFLIDEYENLLDYQQVVFNTLIKHATAYTFKIGVKQLGWRKHYTLNANEQLQSPADYVLIDIAEKLSSDAFATFAEKVCDIRVSKLADSASYLSVKKLFPAVSAEEEAYLLGVRERVSHIRSELQQTSYQALSAEMTDLQLYFAVSWAGNEDIGLSDVLDEYVRDEKSWRTRFENYKFAALFTIRKGRTGIRKYYCGWRTYVLLAERNIRYLLQLVDEARIAHSRAGGNLSEPISYETQTRAAQLVGKKNLTELEGLEVNGSQLTRLLLGLGRVFEQMAATPFGHAPEVSQFHLPDAIPLEGEAESLVRSAIMHQALVRTVATKLNTEDLRAYDYAIHPIYAPFFVFSHRRKRKMTIHPNQLVSLVKNPRVTIKQMLDQVNREEVGDLPEQMQLFEGYYGPAS